MTAAHWIEGLPLIGKEFVTDNVQVLAKRYNIPFEPVVMTEQDLYLSSLYQLYRHAADTLVEFHENRALLDVRGWDAKLCYRMRVGSVPTWPEFRARLIAKGDYTATFLSDAGIYETLFNPYCITFTLFDEHGRPVGFAARDTRWVKGCPPSIKKYKTTETKVPIFQKNRILYGFHLVKDRQAPVTLVEGYPDVLTAEQAGIEGFVALLGTELTDEQVELLQKYGKSDLTLALDFDAESGTGQAKMEKCLDEVLSGKRNLRIKIADVSVFSGGKSVDPDEYLKAQGLNARVAWAQLPRFDAFQWRLNRFKEEPPEKICEMMVKLIVNEPSHARQEVMLKILSDFTKIRIEALQADLDGLLYEQDRRRKDQATEILEQAQKKLRHANPMQADVILAESAHRIRALRRETGAIVPVASSLEVLDKIQAKMMAKGDGMPGLRTGFKKFDERMGGMPKEDCFFVVGGVPHVGKTSWFSQLAWNIANFNEDVCVLFLSIDDSAGQIYPKFVSIETDIPITWVANPRRWLSQDQYPLIEEGWNKVRRMLTLGRLEVRDQTFGSTVGYLASWVEAKLKQFPERHIVSFLDNLHKLRGTGDIRERFREASEDLKTLSQSGRVSVVTTAEISKGTDRSRPMLTGLMETVQIENDATIAAIFHNEYQITAGKTDHYWIDANERYDGERQKPIVDIFIDKNKNIDGAYKGTLSYRFDPKRSKFFESDEIPLAGAAPAVPEKQEPQQGGLFKNIKT